MKYKLLILICIILCIQNKLYAQHDTITISQSDISIEEAFGEIEKQTSYTIAYNWTELDIKQRLNLALVYNNLNTLLLDILENTACDYRIKGDHIIIYAKKNTDNLLADKQDLIYQGKVLDRHSTEPLPYATVCLLNDSNKIVRAGITDEYGFYKITTTEIPKNIQVSFVGYKTATKRLTVGDLSNNETFMLDMKEQMLNEALIMTSTIQHELDRRTFLITSKMREGTSNTIELLDKINEFRFDKISNTLKIGRTDAILFLVDGMQQSQDYVKNLPSERVSKVEIIQEPAGRFVAENHSTIVNFILKKNYVGYAINARNFMMINPANSNGNDWLANEQPEIDITYTGNKFTVYAHYDYKRTRWNLPHNKMSKLDYIHQGQKYETEKVTPDNPNDIYKNQSNHIVAGISYNITPQHIISVQGDYASNNVWTDNTYRAELYGTNPDKYMDTITNLIKDKDRVANIFYKGKIGDKVHLYSDFAYNYYTDSVSNIYSQQGGYMYYKREYHFRETKKHSAFNIEANYSISDKYALAVGYSNTWRKYGSNSKIGEEYINYKEYRNKFFTYLSSNLSDKLSLKLGSSIEQIETINKGDRKTKFTVQPYFRINYSANSDLNLNLSYTSNTDYPSLYQISSMKTVIDTFTVQTGNPELKTSINHILSLKLTFGNKLYINTSLEYSPNKISEVMLVDAPKLYRTFGNIPLKRYMIDVSYNQALGEYFNFKNSILYSLDRINHKGVSNQQHIWLIDSEINYFNPRHDFGIGLGYHKGMTRDIVWQGYQMIDIDNWELTLKKEFFKKKMFVMLSYIPPIDLGVSRYQKRAIDMPLYSERSDKSMKVYNNMLFLRIGFHFNKGNIGKTKKQSTIDRETREKRTIDF